MDLANLAIYFSYVFEEGVFNGLYILRYMYRTCVPLHIFLLLLVFCFICHLLVLGHFLCGLRRKYANSNMTPSKLGTPFVDFKRIEG